MASSPPVSFSLSQRVVHWVMVLMIIWQYFSSGGFEAARVAQQGGGAPDVSALGLIQSHAFVGIAILALAALRLGLRLVQGVPVSPPEEPAFFRLAAKAGHAVMYALLFLLPITGLAAMYGHIEVAGFIHAGPLRGLLMILIALHVAAALVHQFYWKTDVLARMLRG